VQEVEGLWKVFENWGAFDSEAQQMHSIFCQRPESKGMAGVIFKWFSQQNLRHDYTTECA